MAWRPLTFTFAFVWTFGASAASLAIVAILGLFSRNITTDLITMAGVQALCLIGASVLLTERHAVTGWGRHALAMRPTHPALAVLGLGLGLALYAPGESVQGAVEKLAPTPALELTERAIMLDAETPGRAALVVLVIGCAMPLVEELFFRGALFGALRAGHAAIGAALVTALCYTIGHIDLRVWPTALMIGLVASYLRFYSGSILPSLAFNVALRSVGSVAVVQGISSAARPLELPWFAQLFAWTVAAVLLFAVQRIAQKSEQAARARQEDGDE